MLFGGPGDCLRSYDPVQVNVLFLADPVEAALWVECLFSVYHRRSSRSPDPPQQVGHQGLLRSVLVDSNVPHLLGVRSLPSGICHDQQNRPVCAQMSNRQTQSSLQPIFRTCQQPRHPWKFRTTLGGTFLARPPWSSVDPALWCGHLECFSSSLARGAGSQPVLCHH